MGCCCCSTKACDFTAFTCSSIPRDASRGTHLYYLTLTILESQHDQRPLSPSPACSAAQPSFIFAWPIQHSRSSNTITGWRTLWWLLIPPQFSCLENPNPPASLKHMHVAAGNCPPVLRASLPRPGALALVLSNFCFPLCHCRIPGPILFQLSLLVHGIRAFRFQLLLGTGSDTSKR